MDPGLAFAGQYRDTESGLCYNRFRYYDPAGGCYVSPDPIGIAGVRVIMGMCRIRIRGSIL
nr:RHS repeat-associated core domain-containing protein [Pectobacterium odoriferum]